MDADERRKAHNVWSRKWKEFLDNVLSNRNLTSPSWCDHESMSDNATSLFFPTWLQLCISIIYMILYIMI